MKYVLFALIGYLIGSLNFSLIIGKIFYKTDVRDFGSKGAGATNTLRTLGKLPAFTVLILDTVKGVLSYFLAMLIMHDYFIAYISATAAIMGHNFPLFFGFRGGKGVATSLGAVICINPLIGLAALVFAVIVIAISKYVSLGAVSGAVSAFVLFFIFDNQPVKLVLIFIIVTLLIVRHNGNIKRLFSGTENKLTLKR